MPTNAKEEKAYWQRNVVLRISAATLMGFPRGQGTLHYINFSTEYVEDGRVLRKSQAFAELTRRLEAWLKAELVSWRGPHTYDDPEQHTRLFGDQFRERQKR